MTQAREGMLLMVTSASGPDEEEIRALLHRDGFEIASASLTTFEGTNASEFKCEVRWRAKRENTKIPATVRRLRERSGVLRIEWSPKAR